MSAIRLPADIKSIGVIGVGAFGLFLMDRIKEIAPSVQVIGWDQHREPKSTLQDAVDCDVVIFAVPPKAYESAMRRIIPMMREDAIIVDVCTVKMHTVKLLHELAGGRMYIASHPMFGPQSYIDKGRSLRGLQVAVCEHTLPSSLYDALVHMLVHGLGLELVIMSSEDHDRRTAEEQLLTQHVGCIIAKAGFARKTGTAHTVSSRHFYTAMEIVAKDQKLFKEVSELNPFWAVIEARFEVASAELRLEMAKRRNGRA